LKKRLVYEILLCMLACDIGAPV